MPHYPSLKPLAVLLALCLPWTAPAQPAAPLPPPPQDQGLPYTRSARSAALAKLGDRIAVFAGSRYGYVQGFKTRLDPSQLRSGEAVLQDGRILVPAAFAAVLDLAKVKVSPPPAPDGLADRWVYDLSLKPAAPGAAPVDLASLARAQGLAISQHPRGLLIIGRTPVDFSPAEAALLDSVITLFDTPEKLADPDIATRHLPALAAQGPWTDHVKVTPAQLALVNGPATDWPGAPRSTYDESGIDRSVFGSPLPPPGVYPRILLSPEDIPAFAARVQNSIAGRKSLIEMEHLFARTWWDPSTSDGQIFEKLSTGNLAGLEWDIPANTLPFVAPHTFKGQKPGITNSHVPYVPECLVSMALYALVKQDDALGRRVATAFANYHRLREPLLDAFLAVSDSEFASSLTLPDGTKIPANSYGAATHWRNIHGIVGNTTLGPGLDLTGRWMTAEQKEVLRRVIAKATYGRRSHGQDGPMRFRDVNWMTWDTPHFLALTAIEGLPGFDPEAWAAGAESLRAFCDWGIDPAGVVFESNGKSPGAFGAYFMSLVALARRGDNLFAHPHLRRLPEAQVQMTSPNGRTIVNSGTQYVPYSRQHLSPGFLLQLKSVYPQNRAIDYLLNQAAAIGTTGPDSAPAADAATIVPAPGPFVPEAYRASLAKMPRLRLPSLTYPGFVRNVLFDSDPVPATRADIGLPLDFTTPVHGVFSAYSDPTPDATWINLQVRPNHYLGGGHHHADAGMFHFSALGIDWITESAFPENYSGNYHNLVQVDGKSLAEAIPGVINGYNAAATWLGSSSNSAVSSAAADLTYAYSWRWNSQPPASWSAETRALGWEMDPSPAIARIFAGTARYKLRPWWANYTQSNFIATSRAPYNPMEHVFRSVALVRGSRPVAFVVDDVKKDDAVRHYRWTAMLGGGVVRADLPGLPPHAIALAHAGRDHDFAQADSAPARVPAPGEPILVAYSLNQDTEPGFSIERISAVRNRRGDLGYSDQLALKRHAASVNFRVLLIPLRAGQPMPAITYDETKAVATVRWSADQTDTLAFTIGSDARTQVKVTRGATPLLP